ncbi:MAG: AI-2E family transporter [Eubacteriales bacterium]|nr:AI-2E family transporter [Eubacteriales bacterium]
MGKPNKKLKKILLITGVTGAVYGAFRFLLPLVVPFLLSLGAAAALRPSAEWIAGRCRLRLRTGGRERSIGISVGAAGMAELLFVLAAAGACLYSAGRRLLAEALLVTEQIPVWIESLNVWLTALCRGVESALCLKAGVLVSLAQEMLRGLLEAVKAGAMPYLMANSLTVFQAGTAASVFLVILLAGTGLFLQEMDIWKNRCLSSVFREEYRLIARRLRLAANAWLKAQGIIMALTAGICTAGLWLMGNPFYLLAGVGIGLLDALPVFGTGTVLVPWALILFACGSWGRGLVLLAMYVLCCFLREILEAKLMGSRVGLSPLETLISMYVGLQLFGITGFLLGPAGLLLIGDLVKALEV